jgi:ketosteroid isomerase-like protein
MDRIGFEAWIGAYERAWRTAGVEALKELFTEDATYRMSPYAEPVRGLEAIGALWEREREGPGERFEMSYEVVAVDGETGVARIEVAYGSGAAYRDLWVVRFAANGRCPAFEEWPFWPDKEIPPATRPSP